MPEKISILKESGETLISNVVSVFMIPDTEKKYIITTENAVDPHGLTVLHVSEIDNGTLQRVATDEEWSSIKTIMRAIISGNVGSYQYLPTIENINASGQYSRDISVSASASKQMIDNYAAGEKSTVGEVSATSGAEPVVNNTEVTQEASTSSIFPTGNVPVNNEDELIPGISEVPVGEPATAVEPVSTVTVQPNEVQVNSGVDVNTVPEQPNVPLNQGLNTTVPGVLSTMPDASMNNGVMNNDANLMVSNIQVSNNMMNNGMQPVINQVPMQPMVTQENVGIDNPNMGVQVLGPSQVVPTAQIVQEAQSPLTNDIKFDQSVTPSFNPNASLDEVVLGAQEMFMEGVKNLVQTIQEKVYRDLYNKEAELKMREAAVEQREQIVNNQMMAMMSNFGTQQMMTQPILQMTQPIPQVNPAMQQMAQPVQPMQMGMTPVSSVQTTTPVQSVIPPVVTGPTVVSAANDVV